MSGNSLPPAGGSAWGQFEASSGKGEKGLNGPQGGLHILWPKFLLTLSRDSCPKVWATACQSQGWSTHSQHPPLLGRHRTKSRILALPEAEGI